MQLLLIRHGECQHNAKETDNLDSGLTKLGRKQSIELVAFLKRKWGDEMKEWKGFVSPFLRCLQTAQILWEHAEINFDVDWRLREWAHGSSGYHANTHVEVPNRKIKFPEFFHVDAPPSWNVPGENETHLLARMIEFTNFVKKSNYEKIIVISHAMPIYTMIYILKDVPMVPKWDRKITNTSVTWYEHDRIRYFAKFINTGNDPRGDSAILPIL